MHTNPVTPCFTGNVVYRAAKDYCNNKELPYFYNTVLNIVRKQKLPANFQNNHVDITFDPKYQKEAINTFKTSMEEAGVKIKLLA